MLTVSMFSPFGIMEKGRKDSHRREGGTQTGFLGSSFWALALALEDRGSGGAWDQLLLFLFSFLYYAILTQCTNTR